MPTSVLIPRRVLVTCAVSLFSPLAMAVPVAVNDSYTSPEDAEFNTSSTAVLSADFEGAGGGGGGPVTDGAWQYIDTLKNDQAGQTPDAYPVDGSSRDWKAANFDTATSTIPWKSAALPLQGGGVDGIPGAPDVLLGVSQGGAPYTVSTYLFRKTFTLTATEAAGASWTLGSLVVDDAAIFYINGQEVHRVLMDPNTYVPAGTLSPATVVNANGTEAAQSPVALDLTGKLVAGVNVIAVELHQTWGSQNWVSSDAGLNVSLTPSGSGSAAQGFTYQKDTFGTSGSPDANSAGTVESTGGNPGGNLLVSIGRRPPRNPAFFGSRQTSGAWTRAFTLASAGTLTLEFDNDLRCMEGLESNEYGQTIVAIDGVNRGLNGNAWIRQVDGPNGNGDTPVSWQHYTLSIPLSAGAHTLSLGAYSNATSDANEHVEARFDNVTLGSTGGGVSLLANDTGATGVVLATNVSHGTLVLSPDGNFVYTPAANYNGPDAFTYRATDGVTQSAPATVTLNITPVNDAPTGVADAYDMNKNAANPLAAPGVLVNDSDIDSPTGSLTAVLVTPPANGTLTLNPNGSFTYTPNTGFFGPDNFVYRVSDGSLQSSNVQVSLNVLNNSNSAPQAVADEYTVLRNSSLNISQLSGSTVTEDLIPYLSSGWKYVDDGSDQGTIWRTTGFDDTGWKTGAGELGYGDGDEATVIEDNGTPGYNAGDSDRYATYYFRRGFSVTDAHLISSVELALKHDDSGVVYIEGTEVYRTDNLPAAPQELGSGFYSGAGASHENQTDTVSLPVSAFASGANVLATEIHQAAADSSDVSFDVRLRATKSVYGGVLGNDIEPDFETMTATAVSGPAHGSLTLNPDGTFVYTPVAGYLGDDSFTYRASDGVLNSPTTTVILHVVSGPNQPPLVAADSYNGTEEVNLSVSAPGVLANDADGEGDAMTAELATPLSPAGAGILTLNANGSFVVVPAHNFFGAATFTYRARDEVGNLSAPAVVTLNFTNVNDNPVSGTDLYATDPSTPLSVPAPGVLGNDSDPDGQAITAVLFSGPASGTLNLNANGGFTYTPANGVTGNITFVYRASDGATTSNLTTVTIKINGRPVPVGNSYTTAEDTPLTVNAPGLLANDTDPENDPLTAIAVTQPVHGVLSLVSNGGFTFTPDHNYNGADSFTYRVNDGARDSLATATVNLTVTAVDDAPLAVADSYGTGLDQFLSVPASTGVLANDTDPEDDALTATLVAGALHGEVVLGADGSFTYQPEAGYSGTDSFTYQARDGSLPSAVTTVTLSVGINYDDIVINEIMYQPRSLNAAEEYIELYNRGQTPVDLTGWRITAGVGYTFPATMLPANGYVVIAADPAVFTPTYGGVALLRGPWSGQLSNSGETIRLQRPDSAAGDGYSEVDQVDYADQGDWALRRAFTDSNETGWEWEAGHNGGGDSLELINPVMGNNNGQNWSKREYATALAGAGRRTPGSQNTDAASMGLALNIAPLISGVKHRPQIPSHTDPVHVTAVLKDELDTGVAGSVFWRAWQPNSQTSGAFQQAAMTDDGLNGDGDAGDGEYGATLPAQALNAVVEFYVQATDLAGNRRTWPAATDNGNPGGQGANCLYQVDEEIWTARHPVYRLITTGLDQYNFAVSRWNQNSNAGINVTFVGKQGNDIDVRYQSDIRVRGAGSRSRDPRNWRLNWPHDDRWNGQAQANLNIWYSYAQYFGAQLMKCANLPHEGSTAVQVRLNGTNYATNTNASYGMYAHMQPIGDSTYVAENFSNDSNGNIYKKVRPHSNFLYNALPDGSPNITAYTNNGWTKQSNTSVNDWTDLHQLMATMTKAGGPSLAEWEGSIDVDQWCRVFALTCIMNDAETNISNGTYDDFGFYRGVVGPRFKILAHDYDTIFGLGDTSTNTGDPLYQPIINNNAFSSHLRDGETLGVLVPFFQNPVINQRYQAQLRDLLSTVFEPTAFNALVDATLGDWGGGMPASLRTDIKNYLAARRTFILNSIQGGTFSAASNLAVTSGYPRTTTATATGLSGTVDPLTTRRVLVNGVDVTVDNYNAGVNGSGTWIAGNALTLSPGINRVLVQALGDGDVELSRQTIAVWYDDGSVQPVASISGNTTWSAAGGPWRVTANLTIDNETLTIEPGATVYLAPGVSLNVSGTGRLVADGTEFHRIQFVQEPGVSGKWGRIALNGSMQETRISHADIDGAGTTAALDLTNSSGLFSYLVFHNTAVQYFSTVNSSFVMEDSVFPDTTGVEPAHGNGIPAAGYAIYRRNTFGRTTGLNDIIDFTGGQRPSAILQVLDNTFTAAGDDILDLDGTDAHIEGNLFFNVHQETAGGDTASAISGGSDSGNTSEITIVRNFFYNCDHATLAKEGNFYVISQNTIVNINNTGSATGSSAAAFNFHEPARSGVTPGLGALIEGNIIRDCPALFENVASVTGTVTANRNMLPAALPGGVAGSGNLTTDPLLVSTAGVTVANVRDQFRIRPESPATGTGLNGLDRGAAVPGGASISGLPFPVTPSASASLTIGGPGVTHYRYSLDGAAFSAGETPVATALSLTGLSAGPHSVRVIGKNSAGSWQAEAAATQSRIWTVVPGMPPVILNEVLASNVTTLDNSGSHPDLIELRNLSASAIDLTGWSLSDRAVTETDPAKFVFSGITIPANGYLVLYADSEFALPGVHLGFGLDTGGDGVWLYSSAATDNLVDSVGFGPQIPDRSIGRAGADFAWALNVPTPGAANALAPTGSTATLRINEWLGTNDYIIDGDFVELYNPASLPVPLAGLRLTDDPLGNPDNHIIAPLSFIAANGFTRFKADGNASAGPDHLSWKLSKIRDLIVLLDPALSRIDHVISTTQLSDVSQGRTTDGSAALSYFALPTPGFSNNTDLSAQSLVLENLRITEIMYNPAGATAPEFIELRNISPTQTLDISGVSFTNGIDFVFPPGSTLAPGQTIVLSNVAQAAFTAVYPGAPWAGQYGGKLDNGGEQIRLEVGGYPLGILDFSYSDNWYPVTDGGGASLEIVDATAPRGTWGDAVSWRAAAPSPGTDGVFGVVGGEDITLCLPGTATVEALVSYGTVNPGTVTFAWTKVSGPGTVTFGTPGADTSTVSLSQPGLYVVRLTATAGATQVSDTVQIAAAESYAAWSTRLLGSNAAVNGPDKDPDNDGVVNLLEFALGGNPLSGIVSSAPAGNADSGFLTLTYQRTTGCGATYIVESSGNLLTWSTNGVSESRTAVNGLQETWVASDSVPTTTRARRFLRVRVVYAP